MNLQTPNPVTTATRRFNIDFALSMLGYVVTMAVSRNALEGPLRDASDTLQVVVAMSPLIPVAFLFAATIRMILRTDELLRRIIVDSLAIAGGATALLAITYGLIESDRFPYRSAWWTWFTFGTTWIVATYCVRRPYRQ